MRRLHLIVNGDDFGISEEVNEAVLRAFREGILTSCSLMVTGQAFDHAVRLARENPELAVGLHLVTVMGRSVLPPSDIPSLVDGDGNFPSDPALAGIRYYFLPRAREELGKELGAQFRKFEATGLRCSHVDSHLHMHIHPVIFGIAVALCDRHAVRCLRVPQDSLRKALRFDRDHWILKSLHALIFRLLCTSMKRRLRAKGIAFAESVYGHFQTGKMSEGYVLSILESLEHEISEIYCHPAFHVAGPGLDAKRRQELREFELLTSEKVKRRIRDLGIVLTNTNELKVHS